MSEASTIEHEQLMNDYVALWNGGESKLDVVADSITLNDPALDEEIHGREAFEVYLDELRSGFPDFHVEVTATIEQDGTIMGEWRATGTHDGEFNDIPPTNRRMELEGMDRIEIADGTVVEHHIYYDLYDMFEQLGLAEP